MPWSKAKQTQQTGPILNRRQNKRLTLQPNQNIYSPNLFGGVINHYPTLVNLQDGINQCMGTLGSQLSLARHGSTQPKLTNVGSRGKLVETKEFSTIHFQNIETEVKLTWNNVSSSYLGLYVLTFSMGGGEVPWSHFHITQLEANLNRNDATKSRLSRFVWSTTDAWRYTLCHLRPGALDGFFADVWAAKRCRFRRYDHAVCIHARPNAWCHGCVCIQLLCSSLDLKTCIMCTCISYVPSCFMCILLENRVMFAFCACAFGYGNMLGVQKLLPLGKSSCRKSVGPPDMPIHMPIGNGTRVNFLNWNIFKAYRCFCS